MTQPAARPPHPRTVSRALGEEFRQRRRALGYTQTYVAEHAGLTTGFISQVERGQASPSISSLNAISKVLGLNPFSFFDLPSAPDALTRQGERPAYGIAPNTLRYERVTTPFPGNVLRAVIIHEAPGHRSEPIRHEGEELFYIISGELTIELDGTRHVLRAGDTLHFASHRVHSSWNHTDAVTTMLHTCTMDVFGDTWRVAEGGTAPSPEAIP